MVKKERDCYIRAISPEVFCTILEMVEKSSRKCKHDADAYCNITEAISARFNQVQQHRS